MSDQKDVPVTEPTAAPVTDPVAEKLKNFGATDEVVAKLKALGVASIDDLIYAEEGDLVNAGINLIQARKLLKSIAPAPELVSNDPGTAISTVLPQVPNYESLLDMLRAGGVLKVDRSSVTAAVQAWTAHRADLFELPKRLADEILKFAKKNDEPVDPAVYYRLKTELSRVRYGDLFAAIEGFDGRSISASSKKELFESIERSLIPALFEFHEGLSGWYTAWENTSNGPRALQQVIRAMATGGRGVVPGGDVAPDTGILRDQAETVNNAANRVFSGEGVQVAAAVAFETGKIREILRDSSLPARVGAANHEQMLKQLGMTVSSADPRFESNLVQYVLSILQVKNVTGGDSELQYFEALWQLGQQIPWNQLGAVQSGGISTLGRTPRRNSEL